MKYLLLKYFVFTASLIAATGSAQTTITSSSSRTTAGTEEAPSESLESLRRSFLKGVDAVNVITAQQKSSSSSREERGLTFTFVNHADARHLEESGGYYSGLKCVPYIDPDSKLGEYTSDGIELVSWETAYLYPRHLDYIWTLLS